MRVLLLICSLFIVTGCAWLRGDETIKTSKNDAPLAFEYSIRSTPPQPVYNRLRSVRPPSPLPAEWKKDSNELARGDSKKNSQNSVTHYSNSGGELGEEVQK